MFYKNQRSIRTKYLIILFLFTNSWKNSAFLRLLYSYLCLQITYITQIKRQAMMQLSKKIRNIYCRVKEDINQNIKMMRPMMEKMNALLEWESRICVWVKMFSCLICSWFPYVPMSEFIRKLGSLYVEGFLKTIPITSRTFIKP